MQDDVRPCPHCGGTGEIRPGEPIPALQSSAQGDGQWYWITDPTKARYVHDKAAIDYDQLARELWAAEQEGKNS
jgi:hypothetical protein